MVTSRTSTDYSIGISIDALGQALMCRLNVLTKLTRSALALLLANLSSVRMISGHSPPQPDPPDPPDPLQFPPLPSPFSGGQKPPKRCAFSPLSLNSTVPPVPITSTPPSGTAVTPVFGSLPATTTSAAQLLAAYSPNPFCRVENPRSGSSTVPQGPSITVNLPYSLTGPGTLPTPPYLRFNV
ncbi:hypothetical protein DY000_02037315 [Brassica cretica]|uniref:Uncharacterized protein n=1 Tax=Brassica cretica TaxID=69181 RepID=A0ABQ7BGL1_BRACR|nr:hypothetical protein DY000_02037315 [Brassica cretica]